MSLHVQCYTHLIHMHMIVQTCDVHASDSNHMCVIRVITCLINHMCVTPMIILLKTYMICPINHMCHTYDYIIENIYDLSK